MKYKISLLTLLLVLSAGCLTAQSVSGGINFQALFRAQDGSLMSNQQLKIEVNLTSGSETPELYYQEIHDLKTDEFGLLSIPIGRGKFPISNLNDVPWAKGNIWLSISILENGTFREITRNELLSVPYAMHAASAKKLTKKGELSLREDNSIYWLTSGNSKTVPHVHFIGTNDAKDFYIKTNNRTRYVIDKDGLITLHGEKTNIEGADTEKSAYPLVIERAKQGIYIELDVGQASSDNNFVTFADPQGIHGSVEGQTLAECFLDPFYLLDKALFAADLAFTIKSSVDQFSEAGQVSTDGVGAPAAPGAILNGAAQVASAAYKTATQVRDLLLKIEGVGVSYNSGGADYAEWLPKTANSRDLFAGEVVGLKNGKISLNTKEAERVMVISSNPILLGNEPSPKEKHRFEKVAFLGQVYVSVLGEVKSGDFILPSGNHDGFAIAVPAEELKAGDYQHIIGVAWDSVTSKGGLSNVVRVAVGINANDLSKKVAALETKTTLIKGYLRGENPMPTDKNIALLSEQLNVGQSAQRSSLESTLSEEAFDELVSTYGPYLKSFYSMTESMLAEEGFKVSDYPAIQAQFEDPVALLKALKRDERYTSQMAAFELALLRIN